MAMPCAPYMIGIKKDEIYKDNRSSMAQCEGELILKGEKCLKPISFAVNQCDMLLHDVS